MNYLKDARFGKAVACVALFSVYFIGLQVQNVRTLSQENARASTSFPMDDPAKFLLEEEIIVPKRERKPTNKIRYAAFGSSVTWGAALEDRKKEAYIWKLSDFDEDRGKNYAIRATGPDYPSQCVSSMIGDEEFDVIILEFYMHAHEGLISLALRLRERFPDAIIIFTRLWGPYQILQENENMENVNSWAIENGFDEYSFIHDKAFHDKFLNEAGENWKWWPGHRNQKGIQEKAVELVGGYLIHMPFNDKPGGPGGWLNIGDELLADDSFHLSVEGHAVIADSVKKIVDRVGVPKTKRVAPFSIVDQCYNWIQSGSIGKGLTFGPSASIVKMPNTEKFALEFDFEGGPDGTWIKIESQSNQEMNYAIGFMTSGPPPSKYPKVVATISGSGEEFILRPDASSTYGDKPVHITRLRHLGILKPLAHKRINFRPLEKTEWPFRLVQIMVTPIEDNSQLLEITA